MWWRGVRAAGVYLPIGRHGGDPMAWEETLMTTFMTFMLCATTMGVCTEATTLVIQSCRSLKVIHKSCQEVLAHHPIVFDFFVYSLLQELHWWSVVLLWWQWGFPSSWRGRVSADGLYTLLPEEDSYSLLVGQQLCCWSVSYCNENLCEC